MLQFPEFESIRNSNPVLYDGLIKLTNAVQQIGAQSGTGVGGTLGSPPNIGSISVAQANGYAVVTINDGASASLGVLRPISYFVLYDTKPVTLNSPHLSLGPARVSPQIFIGNGTYYFGAYSTFGPGNPVSPIATFGPVVGSGSVAPPTPTAPIGGMSGIGPGGGYGLGNTR